MAEEPPVKDGPTFHRGIDVPPRRVEGAHPPAPTTRDVVEHFHKELEEERQQERQPRVRDGRNIVVFMDGTNNTPEELRHTRKYDLLNPPPVTNVVRLLRGVLTDDTQTKIPQVINYFRGV